MGKRGPKPTPTAVRLFTGMKTDARHHVSQPKPDGEVPVSPDWIGDQGKKFFTTIAPRLHEVGCLTPIDESLFALLCESWNDYLWAVADIRQRGLLVDGYRGSKVINSAYRIKLSATETIIKLSAMFGMSPSSRVGLSGVPQDEGFGDLESFKNS